MRPRMFLMMSVAIALAATSIAAQSTGARKVWTPPRTPDGQPDIQSIWTNATLTPFERPASLRDKAFLTEAEAQAIAHACDPEGPPHSGLGADKISTPWPRRCQT